MHAPHPLQTLRVTREALRPTQQTLQQAGVVDALLRQPQLHHSIKTQTVETREGCSLQRT